MKEHIKTILLILLSAALIVLIWQTWAYEPAILQALPGEWGRTETPRETEDGDGAYAELSDAVLPAQLAQLRDGTRTGALWDSAEVSRAMPVLSRALGLALGSASAPQETTAQAWQRALERDSVYLRYTEAVPLDALGVWNSSYDTALDAQARRLTLCVEDGKLRLFYEDISGNLFVCDTAAPAQLPELGLAVPCTFAFERGGAFTKPEPLQLLPEPIPVFSPLSAGPHGDIQEAARDLLRALGIDPDTPYKHEEPDGVTYVDYLRQCRVMADGYIYYNDPAPSDRPLPVRTQPPLPGQIEAARELVAALSPALGDAEWELRGLEREGAGTVLRFGVHVGGCPVLGPGGAYALLKITGGGLEEAFFYLRAYHRRDEMSELIPAEQALAAIPEGERGFTLTAAYLDHGDEELLAQWAR